jgi:hypothetical protein
VKLLIRLPSRIRGGRFTRLLELFRFVIADLRLTAEYPPSVTIGVRMDVYPSNRSIFLTADSDSFVCLGVVDNAIDGGHFHGANPGKISLHSLTAVAGDDENAAFVSLCMT